MPVLLLQADTSTHVQQIVAPSICLSCKYSDRRGIIRLPLDLDKNAIQLLEAIATQSLDWASLLNLEARQAWHLEVPSSSYKRKNIFSVAIALPGMSNIQKRT